MCSHVTVMQHYNCFQPPLCVVDGVRLVMCGVHAITVHNGEGGGGGLKEPGCHATCFCIQTCCVEVAVLPMEICPLVKQSWAPQRAWVEKWL